MGLRKIEEKLTQEAEMKRKGADFALKSLEKMNRQVRELHDELKQLEKKYQQDIKKNPELSQALMNLRDELGLPRAIGIFDIGKAGKDEYINFLALRIIEVGKELKQKTGGLISVSELIIKLNDENQGITVSISDIISALDTLKTNGLIHNIRQLGGVKVVEFINPELTSDHQIVLEIASRFNGQIGLMELVRETSWTIERVNQMVDSLVKKKIAIKTETLDGLVISFPGI